MQKRDNYIEVEDFLDDSSFQLWILFKIDEQSWEEWTLENRQRAKLVEDARLLLLAMKVPNTISSSQISNALQSTWINIEEKENLKNTTKIYSFKYLRKYRLEIAATLSPKVRNPVPRLSISSGPTLASASILSRAAVEENDAAG